MSDLRTQADLIVATMQLSVVRLLRDAIRTTAKAAQQQGLPGAAPTIEPRRHLHPEAVIEPRRHVHPEPVYERRAVIHPRPRIEQTMLACPPRQTSDTRPTRTPSPIQPPWKVLPWENPVQPSQTIKIHLHHTDVIHKGTLLDLFV